ncbi:nitroreductase family protein [Duganella callida]|uniref:Molybdopterin biosynthesis protein MoeY n=1 Tax=Duganella callida TaxID=2561932 RepID=A0A4Y9SEL9_9BURK|nr:nitroreductase family protein [Duganella callida]TFW19279.1 molybdopterin biosynthesis protein MoeY [Duganella callida]
MSADQLQQVLNLTRWAPSGDNTQPWRFEIVDDMQVRVHCQDTRDHVVYDLDGRPSQIAFGAMLETMHIAASAQGWRAETERVADSPEQAPVFAVRFHADPAVRADPLLGAIETRSVQRRAMSTRPLTAAEKQALQDCVGGDYQVQWLEGFGNRLKAARLMYRNAGLRLTMPEAYEVHRDIIEWDAQFSEDKVPDQALGVDAMTLRLMRWGMRSWRRLERLNAVLGTSAPRLQMDLIPGLACAAHFVIRAHRAPQGIDDYVAAGRAVQRFWLTLTALGLSMQPEMTPLIFARYVSNGVRFSRDDKLLALAASLREELQRVIGTGGAPVFMGRLGAGPAARARSLRKALPRLMRAASGR